MDHSQPNPQTDAVSLIEQEIASAENNRLPISRQMLAELLHERTGFSVSDSYTMVDNYCETNAQRIPHYLQEEFAIPYLKVIAVMNVVISGGLYYWAITVHRRGDMSWPWMCAGTIFLGIAGLAWVKSLERFAERKARARASN